MLKINLKKYTVGLMLLGLLTGCSEEFLDRPPLDRITDVQYYKTTDQVLMATAPLYSGVWFGYNDKAAVGIGDGRGGTFFSPSYEMEHVRLASSPTQESVNGAWQSFFNIVGQSNAVINNVNKFADPAVPENIKLHAIGEARFFRGLAYSYLVQTFGPVPLLEDNTKVLTDTSIARNTVESVWDFIIRDIRYASKVLPASPVQKSRLTKYSAQAMLSRMFLTRAGVGSNGTRRQSDLDSAAYYAKSVIDANSFNMLPNYEDLYLTKNNGNEETVAALQWVYNGGSTYWGAQNTQQAYMAYSSSITGFGDGWGGDHGATMDILKSYEEGDKRRKATYMFPGDVYSYITEEVNDPNKPGAKIKRPLQVTTDNNGADAFKTRANIKKYVVGRPEDNDGKVVQMGTEIQTYLMRYSEVLLIYAEAILGNNASTADAGALNAFNAVRVRAGVPAKTEITWEDIYRERRVELAMEGQSWYDIVRLHYYNPTLALDKLSKQDRGTYRITPNAKVNATSWTIESVTPQFYSVNESSFFVPYPAAELSRAPNLRKEPVPYQFQ
ncbi:RagB/SusD family nutrient uptake outer membrane protein [Adhaeribacter swui]|uniref:RagB/SusD family nutrient uptake outer membrane protein n=1 Tax=Adhaeribacter swui TaxID=2086471 RepID=A0A7G7GET9_9BACT|nr:RagB/SusD family nutrient uptake outer membrane protein [Adhaeribacter swui]QNF35673.1 RagB/SusD family nutrient uptake outer membrane protein [Adhaeribacter swui]